MVSNTTICNWHHNNKSQYSLKFANLFSNLSILIFSYQIEIFRKILKKSWNLFRTTVRFTSMNPGLFWESILSIFSGSILARDKPNTNFLILVPRAFTWAYQIFTPTNSTSDIIQNMILSHFFDLLKKCFHLRNWNFFHQISSFRYLLWIKRRHFNISSKNGHQSMDLF